MLLGSRTIGALGGSRVPRSRRPGGAGPHGLDAQQVRRLPRLKIPRCGLISRLPPNSNPPARSPPRPDERMAWCELRAGCMDHRAIGQSERRQRCAGDLFTRCDNRECIRRPLVRGAEDREHGMGYSCRRIRRRGPVAVTEPAQSRRHPSFRLTPARQPRHSHRPQARGRSGHGRYSPCKRQHDTRTEIFTRTAKT
jgi:hypothetical protein